MNNRYFKLFSICLLVLTMGFWFACDYPEPVEPSDVIALQLAFASTPGATATIAQGASMTFQWSAVGGSGGILYSYTFTDVTDNTVLYEVTNLAVTSLTVSTMSNGHNYSLAVSAVDSEGETDDASFSFSANVTTVVTTPSVSIVSPKTGYKYATGTRVLFEWMASDPSETAVESRFKLTGLEYSGWEERTSWGSTPLVNGTYSFDVEVRNEAGTTSSASVAFTVLNANILIVDERSEPNYNLHDGGEEKLGPSGEFQMDSFYDKCFKGYAFKWWDANELGSFPQASDLTGINLIVWIGSDANAGFGWDYGFYWDYFHSDRREASELSTHGALDDIKAYTNFMDAGGHFWLIDENALDNWSYRANVMDLAIVDSTVTPATVTHYDSYWKKYFGFQNDGVTTEYTVPTDSTPHTYYERTGASSTLGWGDLRVAMSVDPGLYPNMTVDVAKTYNAVFVLDNTTYFTPDAGAEIVFYVENPDGAFPDRGACVATTSGSGWGNVFMGFQLYYVSVDLATTTTQYFMSKFGL